MVVKPTFGEDWISVKRLNSLSNYFLFTMEEPWDIIKDMIVSKPTFINFNREMSLEHLNKIFETMNSQKMKNFTIVGMGGGTSSDTAKFIAWKLKSEYNLTLPLILIPSIISVDAFLCSSIAVRIEGKVNYIGESAPKEILIDFDLIKNAPKYLNRAGVSDTISITSALGDWKIARDEVYARFDSKIFNRAKRIAEELMEARWDIREINSQGIKALVNGFYQEVVLCEEWGNARPEEGSEHFLAYCLESITHEHYIHGNIIGLNILISLYLQEDNAVFSMDNIKHFFQDIFLDISPKKQNISLKQIETALKHIKNYVLSEKLFYSIYNSPNLILDDGRIKKILNFVKTL